jgi:CRP-like cAMP-binding protein
MTRLVETLARIPLFRSLEPEEIHRLDTQCGWRSAAAGDWVIEIAAPGTDAFFVVQGLVQVLIPAENGRRVILRDIGPGEMFGELAAIDGRPRSAGIRAAHSSVVAQMPAAALRDAVHHHPDVCDQLMALLAAEIRRLANQVNELSTLSVRQRLRVELARLARPDGMGGGVISPPPLHQDLAARIATHREAVTRELNVLERQGTITRRRGAFAIGDLALLVRGEAGPGGD